MRVPAESQEHCQQPKAEGQHDYALTMTIRALESLLSKFVRHNVHDTLALPLAVLVVEPPRGRWVRHVVQRDASFDDRIILRRLMNGFVV